MKKEELIKSKMAKGIVGHSKKFTFMLYVVRDTSEDMIVSSLVF